MNEFVDKTQAFWIRIMEKLNANSDLYQPIPEILQDLCDYFGFGCAFVYIADHTGRFFLNDWYAKYGEVHLENPLDLNTFLDGEEMEDFATASVVAYSVRDEHTSLKDKLARLFQANLFIIVPVTDQHGKAIAFVGFVDRRGSEISDEEIRMAHAVLSALANHTKIKLYQFRAESAQKSLEDALDNMGVDVYVNDFNTHEILYTNKTMAEPYGGKEKLRGQICWKAFYNGKSGECDFCPQSKLLDENGEPTKVYSWDYERPFDGSWFRVFSGAFNWTDGRLAHVVTSVDITENKRNEKLVREMAEMDALTRLPNRRKLLADCEEMLSDPAVECGYMIFFDLDGFKTVNDTHGHLVGDKLLVRVGADMLAFGLTSNHTYRNGGDEFVVLCPGMSFEDVLEIIDYTQKCFNEPKVFEEATLCCPASMGVAAYPADAEDTDGLLHASDEAMYAAKRTGRGRAFFYNGGDICTMEEYKALCEEREIAST